MTDDIRIVTADDHPIFLDGLRVLMDSVPGITVVGEATNGSDAIELAVRLQPDVVLMDINMPGVNGIEASRAIHAARPQVRIIILTMYDEDETVLAAIRAGALGYLLKGAGSAELLRGIMAAAHGEAIFGPAAAQRLIHHLSVGKSDIPWQAFPELTDREREILDLVARGMRNQEIGDRLYISPKTVRNYISSILGKLQVVDRAEAITLARSAGFGA